MKLPKLEDLNNERFLGEVLEEPLRQQWAAGSRIRRNVYMALFIIGLICMVYTALVHRMTLCILSLFLATVSLVVMTKYNTQLQFLKVLTRIDEQKMQEPDHS
jgi:hypothetical protein